MSIDWCNAAEAFSAMVGAIAILGVVVAIAEYAATNRKLDLPSVGIVFGQLLLAALCFSLSIGVRCAPCPRCPSGAVEVGP